MVSGGQGSLKSCQWNEGKVSRTWQDRQISFTLFSPPCSSPTCFTMLLFLGSLSTSPLPLTWMPHSSLTPSQHAATRLHPPLLQDTRVPLFPCSQALLDLLHLLGRREGVGQGWAARWWRLENDFLLLLSPKVKLCQWHPLLGRAGSGALAAAPLFGRCFSSNVQKTWELCEQEVGIGSSLPSMESKW